jgi:hypothetical protein
MFAALWRGNIALTTDTDLRPVPTDGAKISGRIRVYPGMIHLDPPLCRYLKSRLPVKVVLMKRVITPRNRGLVLRRAKSAPDDVQRCLGASAVRVRLHAALAVVIALAACAPSSHVLVGKARPPIAPEQVKIYSHPPATPFEEVAVLDATSKSVFGTGGQKSVDKVVERLKIEAAKLGANGVILEGFSDAETGSIGTGVGSDSYGSHSAVGVGVGGSLGIYKKTGHGDAIYVPAGQAE